MIPIEAKTSIGTLGEITCIVRRRDGSEEVYPTESNTHTYGWFNQMTSNNSLTGGPKGLTNGTYCHIGTGTTPITKNSVNLSAPLPTGSYSPYVSILANVDIGGVMYQGCEETHTFAYGAVNALVTEVGLTSNYTPGLGNTGLRSGKVLDTPVNVTVDDQLVIKYKRLYSGALMYALNSSTDTWVGTAPVVGSGSFTYNSVTYTWEAKGAVIRSGGYYPSVSSLSLYGPQTSSYYFYHSATPLGVWTQAYSGAVRAYTLLSPNTTTRDFIKWGLKETIAPSAGNLTIAKIGIGDPYQPLMAITFDPPLPKTNQEKIVIDYTLQLDWAQA